MMCLFTLSTNKPAAEGIGWKWLHKDRDGKLITSVLNHPLDIGVFVKASGDTLRTDKNYNTYPAGFHIYTSLEEAKRGSYGNNYNNRLYRVAYRGAHTAGLGDGGGYNGSTLLRQVVADEIKVLFEEGKRPQRDVLGFSNGEFVVGTEDAPETEALEFRDGEFHIPAYV